MKTAIDKYLEEYLLGTMDNESITEERVQNLLDNIREEYCLECVFILENLADKYEFVYSYMSTADEDGVECGKELHIRPDEYNALIGQFDNENICMWEDNDSGILSFAYMEGHIMKGSVGFRDCAGRVWRDEEKEAIKKLARCIHSFVIISEAKKFIYQSMLEGAERERKYQKELEQANKKLKLALSSNDGMFRQMLKLQSCGIIAYRLPEWELFMINDMAKEIYECEDDCDFEQFNADNVTYKDRGATMHMIDTMYKPGDSVTYEFEVKHKDGVNICVDAISNIIETDAGDRFFISSLRDVTTQKKLEDALELEKSQYRDAIMSDVDIAYTFDVTEGVIAEDILDNGRGKGFIEYGLEAPVLYDDFIKRWSEIKKPHFLNGGTSSQIMQKALLRAYGAGKNNLVYDYEVPCEDCCIRYTILMSANPKNGHVIACVTLKDVTEIMWLEERRQNELKRTNDTLKRQMYIINSLGDIYFAVAYVDVQKNHYSRINARGHIADILDYEGIATRSLSDMVDMYVEKKYADKMKEFVDITTLNDRMAQTNVICCEFVGHGSEWVRASFIRARMDSEGRLKQVLFTMQIIDKEKRKELEQQKALSIACEAADNANRAKSDFLSKMSHDIRTPLNAIIGMTAIASSHAGNKEKVIDCMNKISGSGQYLLALINEVLDMSKIESGKIILSEDKFNISALINNLIEMTKPLVNAKKHELTVDMKNIEHNSVVGDSLRIQQIFTNLLSNSVKYTPQNGKLRLTVREKKNEKKADTQLYGCYEFIFEDNGIGMSSEFIKKIFTPFERAKDSRTDKIQGTGLGMTIAYNLAQMMNGNIEVTSELDKGSKFVVTIFLKFQEPDDTCNNSDSMSESERPLDIMTETDFTGKRILIVEDNEINREIATEIISETGADIETACDGQEAIELIMGKPERYYDLIFMDIQMPVKNGYEATEEIRKMDRSDLREIPIIAMTANAFAEDVLEARNAGMNEHISKPIDLARLNEVMRRWIR